MPTISLPTSDQVNTVLQLCKAEVIGDDQFRQVIQAPLVSGIDRWALWLLLGLLRHERRQHWVGSIVVERLGGDLNLIGPRIDIIGVDGSLRSRILEEFTLDLGEVPLAGKLAEPAEEVFSGEGTP